LYWLSDYNYAIRNAHYKLIINERDKTIQLFDLQNDCSESKDLKADKDEIRKILNDALTTWIQEMPPMRWPRIMDYQVEINGKLHSWAV
jgi:hypothetical protein